MSVMSGINLLPHWGVELVSAPKGFAGKPKIFSWWCISCIICKVINESKVTHEIRVSLIRVTLSWSSHRIVFNQLIVFPLMHMMNKPNVITACPAPAQGGGWALWSESPKAGGVWGNMESTGVGRTDQLTNLHLPSRSWEEMLRPGG